MNARMKTDMDKKTNIIESHPWEPFIPKRAKILIMGTFPPKRDKWSMDFYYPNRINDFWRVMGVVFFDNKDRFYDALAKQFRLDDIKRLLEERGIALNDTGAKVRRLKDNASDKYLEIVEPVDVERLLRLMPECKAMATTGQKAAEVISELTHTKVPPMGESVEYSDDAEKRRIEIFRMPSTSRAYPMALEKKAEYYQAMFRKIGLI